MIIKPREVPLHLLKLKALLRRIPPHHPKVPLIQESIAKCTAGYKGENAIDYPLSFLPEKSYAILHDLRLQSGNHVLQIDTLLVSKHFILILEVKNIAGTLFFDHVFQQLIRTKDNQKEAFPDPLLQVNRQKQLLTNWIGQHNLPQLPILSFVVISNPSTIIRTAPENKKLHEQVIHRDVLPIKITLLEKQYSEERLSEKDVKKICRQLQKHHVSMNKSILDQYQLTKADIMLGVQCPSCSFIPMTRVYGAWMCSECSVRSRDAVLSTLMDYYLLVGPSLSNLEARKFLQIKSPFTANRVLHSVGLSYSGENKARVYYLLFETFPPS